MRVDLAPLPHFARHMGIGPHVMQVAPMSLAGYRDHVRSLNQWGRQTRAWSWVPSYPSCCNADGVWARTVTPVPPTGARESTAR